MLDRSDTHLLIPPQSHLQRRATVRRNTRKQNLVLVSLARHGVMTYLQLKNDTGIPYKGITRIIQRLVSRREVCRCSWISTEKDAPRSSGPVVPVNVCALTKDGQTRLIKDKLILGTFPVATRSWQGQLRYLKNFTHDKNIVDMLTNLRLSFEKIDDISMQEIRVAATKCKCVSNSGIKRTSSTHCKLADGKFFIPDAIFRTKNIRKNRITNLYVEYEHRAQPSFVRKECAKKFDNYKKLFLGETEPFPSYWSVLLYVVSDKTRISEIFKMEQSIPLYGVLRVAHIDDVLRDPLGSVWIQGEIVKGHFSLKKWSPVTG